MAGEYSTVWSRCRPVSRIAMFLWIAVVSAAVPTRVLADVVRYTDGAGKEHFVSSLDRVPEEYREQAKGNAPLPPLSKVAPGREKLYEKERYEAAVPVKGGVEIFVTSWCPHCANLEQFLKSEGIHYTRFDIERDAKGRKLHEELGGGGVPVTRIGGKTIVRGFNPEAIRAALKRS